MGIKVLDERHKRFAEMMLAMKPRTMRERAAELGVDRATLYLWVKDPLWQAYYDKLAEEVHEARVQRLTPLVLNACDALNAALDNAIKDLTGTDSDARKHAPGVSTLAGVTKTLVELERVDAGKPSSISRSERHDDKPLDKASEQLLAKLEELFKDDEEDTVSEERGESKAPATGQVH